VGTAVATARYAYQQTKRHFALIRSAAYIERFNSLDYMRFRVVVEESIRKGTLLVLIRDGESSPDPKAMQTQVLMFANLFHELGSSFRMGVLDPEYVWRVFGYLVKDYWAKLEPAIAALRQYRERSKLYEDFQYLKSEMDRMDEKHKVAG
jgi:hypothetical protein